jgi:hypothetical protein
MPPLSQQIIDRLRQETNYLRARSSTIGVPLFLMLDVLDAAETGLRAEKTIAILQESNAGLAAQMRREEHLKTVGPRCCAAPTQAQAGAAQQHRPTNDERINHE